MDKCPNCGTQIESSFFKNNKILSEATSQFINAVMNKDAAAYCDSCGRLLYQEAIELQESQSQAIKKEFLDVANFLPVITLHNPEGWKYEVVDLVTSQMILGTGLVAEISSNFSDFFGAQSNTYGDKIKKAENYCKNVLRYEALMKGANAIIGTDIDYSEAGGSKAMLMVCMSGTAVRLKNPEVMGHQNEIKKIIELSSRMSVLSEPPGLFHK